MIDFSKYNGIVISTPTIEESDKLLKHLEENSDILWRSGKKPTEYDNWHGYSQPSIFIKEYEDGLNITTGELERYSDEYKFFTVNDFIIGERKIIDLFEEGVIAVQLNTECEWEEFLQYLTPLGYRWKSGNSAADLDEKGYRIGFAVSTDGNKENLGYSSVKWHMDNGFEIMSFDDMMEEVKEKENTMFERGDIVKVIDEEEDYFGQKGEYVKDNGMLYRHVVLFENGETNMFKKDGIRFVCAAGDDECIEEHCGGFGREEGKLRVGDTVYFKDNSEDVEAEGVGTIVAIKEGGRPYLVHSEDLEEFGHDGALPGNEYKQDNGSNWWFYSKHLSLVAPEEDFTAKVLFNRGDKVKFVGGPHGMSGIGTVLKHVKDETVLVHSPDIDGHSDSSEDNKNNWWFSEDRVTLVERTKEKEEEEKKEKKTMFEIGDKVKFKDRDQEGVGIVVDHDTNKRSRQTYLVYSEDIVNGHDGRGFGEEDQDNRNNWWFGEEEIEHYKNDEKVREDWVEDFLNQKFGIKVNKEAERDAILSILEENNVKWQSGHKATEFTPDVFPYYIVTTEIGYMIYKSDGLSNNFVESQKLIEASGKEVEESQDRGESNTSNYVTTNELINHLKDYMGSEMFDIKDGYIETLSMKIYTTHQDIEFSNDSSFTPEGIEHLNFILAYLATPIAARGSEPKVEEEVDLVSKLREDIDELFEEEYFIDDIREKLLDLADKYE